jgi:hypothetical protein
MARAGDGNVRSSESIVKPQDFINSGGEERLIVNLTVKITSGGLKDFIVVSFQPEINTNIHVAKPSEVISFGDVLFSPPKQGAQWFEAEGQLRAQLIPKISSGDRLNFYITSKKNVGWISFRYTSYITKD